MRQLGIIPRFFSTLEARTQRQSHNGLLTPNLLARALTLSLFLFAAAIFPFNANGQDAYITQYPFGISVIDTTTNTVVTTITTNTIPFGTAVTSTNVYAYTLGVAGSAAYIIDTTTNTITSTVGNFGFGSTLDSVGGIAASADGRRVYLTAFLNTIGVIDTTTGATSSIVQSDGLFGGLALSSDGAALYATNFGFFSDVSSNTVSLFNTVTGGLITKIVVGSQPLGLTLSPDGKLLLVANYKGYSLSLVSTTTNTVIKTIDLSTFVLCPGLPSNSATCPLSGAGAGKSYSSMEPWSVVFSPTGSVAYASVNNGSSTGIVVVDTSPLVDPRSSILAFIPDNNLPFGIDITADGSRLYAADYLGTVSVIDTAARSVVKTIPIGSRGYALGRFIQNGSSVTHNLSTSGKRLGCGCVGQAVGGDPITISNGNLFEQETDYQTSGQNPLSFIRYYNSQGGTAPITSPAKTLGNNWRSNYDRYLILNSSTSVTAERANGQQLNFTLSNGAWTTDSDVDITLINSGGTWTLTDSTDTTETYTAAGSSTPLLKSIRSRNGYTQTLTYNSSGQPTSIADSYNRSLGLAYSGSQLQSVATPDGLIISYAFTSATGGNQLTKVTYSTSPATSRSYVYENTSFPFALTGIIDEKGNRYSTWTYDSSGRALTSKLGSNAALTTIVYNGDGSRTVTNALGVTDTYLFTTLQGVPKVTEIDRAATSTTAAAKQLFTYDANGYTASQTDWNGNVTTYVNNLHGLPTNINEAVGMPQARTTTITYDSTWVRLPSVIVTPGLTTSFTYDSNGEVLQKTLTDTTATTIPYSTGEQSHTWTYTWANSLLASSQGPRSDVQELTKFSYDSTGALVSTTNALGQMTKITQHTPGGLPQTIVDPNGVTTNLTYDARQRPLSSAVATAGGVLTTKYTYDAAGNLVTTTLPDGSALTNSYDSAHRLTGVTDLFKQSVAYTLDALGDRIQTNVLNAAGTGQRKHSANFDALGRLLQDIGGVGQTTTVAHDSNGNAITVTDPLTNKTQAVFDALNRPISSADPVGNVTFTSYDAHDRPISVTDPNGGTTSYTYNGFGDLIQQMSPTTGTTVYRYDPDGNQIQRVDARGVTTNWTYDALDRVATTTYPGNTAENVTYTYDQTGHGFGIGRLTSLTDASGTLGRSYDERGDILSETRVQGVVTLSTSYTYDAAQRVISIGYPSGSTATYTRDAMGRVTAISTKPAGAAATQSVVVSGIAYQPFGPPNAMSYGNGVTEARSFDADYRETLRSDTGKTALQKFGYAYDLANNVSSITDSVTTANSQAFGYDALNRLITANGSYGKLGYTYDAIGNRVSDSSSIAPSTLDGLGSLNTITYNQSGRVSAVMAGSTQIAGYSYDAFGHRLARTGASAGLYQYDLSSHLIEETDGQGNPQADYIYLGNQPVASVAPSSGRAYFLHDDRLGIPQVATDGTQTIMWQANYQPFGATSTGTGLITQDLRLPGQEFDNVTGWNHNGFREYVPAWGRYSQSDPIGLAGDLSLYRYAMSNPVALVDLKGLQYSGPPLIETSPVPEVLRSPADNLEEHLKESINSQSEQGDALAGGAELAGKLMESINNMNEREDIRSTLNNVDTSYLGSQDLQDLRLVQERASKRASQDRSDGRVCYAPWIAVPTSMTNGSKSTSASRPYLIRILDNSSLVSHLRIVTREQLMGIIAGEGLIMQ